MTIGYHAIMDYYDIDPAKLVDEAELNEVMLNAASAAGATVLKVCTHKFDGAGGVTGIALLGESHISFHTWPEKRSAAVDVFTCGNTDVEKAVVTFNDYFKGADDKLLNAGQKLSRGEHQQKIADDKEFAEWKAAKTTATKTGDNQQEETTNEV